MLWECSECGAQLPGARKPVRCGECGTAGGLFVEIDDDPEFGSAENLRAYWLQAGLEQAERQLAA
jgi:hypothetical protein